MSSFNNCCWATAFSFSSCAANSHSVVPEEWRGELCSAGSFHNWPADGEHQSNTGQKTYRWTTTLNGSKQSRLVSVWNASGPHKVFSPECQCLFFQCFWGEHAAREKVLLLEGFVRVFCLFSRVHSEGFKLKISFHFSERHGWHHYCSFSFSWKH